MKNHINERRGLFYYSTTQQIKRNGEVYADENQYKVEIYRTDDRYGYILVIKDIQTKEVIEVIESLRFDCDNSRQTNFYGKTDRRQAVIMWDAPLTVGLAKTNIAGFDLLINIFDQEEAQQLLPSVENALEFLNSSAPFIRANGYNQNDLWGRMRAGVIQYILRYAPQYRNNINFVSGIEENFKVDNSDIFYLNLENTFEMVEQECDRCAAEMIYYQEMGNSAKFNTYRRNVSVLSGVYMHLIMLLG